MSKLNLKEDELMNWNRYLGMFFVFLIIFMGVVFAAPGWFGDDLEYQVIEDTLYTHNFTANVSSPLPYMTFGVNTNNNKTIIWNGVSYLYGNFSSWIYFSNFTAGTFLINSTLDNQSGHFFIPIEVTWAEGSATTTPFNFTINASNDAPVLPLANNYTLRVSSVNNYQSINLIGSDEELQYPLTYNLSFGSCDLASWSTRLGPPINCTLPYSLSSVSNTTAILNFTNFTNNEVGNYNITICVHDNVNATSLPEHRVSNYALNKTTCKNTTIVIEKALGVDISNCTNRIINENVSFSCYINVTTKGVSDSLKVWSNSTLRNTGANILNSSWFFPLNNSFSSSFTQVYYVNVIPQKSEIGNLTINFTVRDITTGENSSSLIYIYVNRTFNDVPSFTTINNVTTSIDLPTQIYFNVSDDDLLIPDKQLYNEISQISYEIYNFSNLSQVIVLSNFTLYSSGTGLGVLDNLTRAKIMFTANSSEYGNYTVNLSVRDTDNAVTYTSFNIQVLHNSAPIWNESMQHVLIIYENNLTYLNLSSNVSDTDGDSFTFSYSTDTSFPSFNLNASSGEVNFTPNDLDVGQHILNVTASDGYLTAMVQLNFTVLNVNDPLVIDSLTNSGAGENATVDSQSNINTTEGNQTTIVLWIYDNDILIPVSQKRFYNESFDVNLTIIGPNSSLFRFVPGTFWPTNKTEFVAVFNPGNSDVGFYNIIINVTDKSNYSQVLAFNITIADLKQPPVLTEVQNQTASILEPFNYTFIADDAEDGNSSSLGNYNFTFRLYDSLGVLNFNSTYFNVTTGRLSVLFNQTQAGNHLIYLNVTDRDGMTDIINFSLKIYNRPNITYPSQYDNFTSVENVSSDFIFAINHSVMDSLNYTFYLNSDLIASYVAICNGSNSTFVFTPNFTQETYDAPANFSIFVFNPYYPNLNFSRGVYFNINHSDYPVEQYMNIPNQSATSPLILELGDYFRDIDAVDVRRNQTIKFGYNLVTPLSGAITFASDDWVNGTAPNATFTSTSSASGIYSIIAYEYNESDLSQIIGNVTSNNFRVDLNVSVEPTVIRVPSTGGSSSGTNTYNNIKLIVSPGTVIKQNDSIVVPFQIKNSGQDTLFDINLSSLLTMGDQEGIRLALSNTHLAYLSPGGFENFSLYITTDTKKTGRYLVTLLANVSNPKVSDWADFYLDIVEPDKNDANKLILFTEQLFVDNPECLELNEILSSAKNYLESGDYTSAIKKAQEVVDACKQIMSINSKKSIIGKMYSNYPYYFVLTLSIMVIFLVYLIYKRARFKSKFPHNI